MEILTWHAGNAVVTLQNLNYALETVALFDKGQHPSNGKGLYITSKFCKTFKEDLSLKEENTVWCMNYVGCIIVPIIHL